MLGTPISCSLLEHILYISFVFGLHPGKDERSIIKEPGVLPAHAQYTPAEVFVGEAWPLSVVYTGRRCGVNGPMEGVLID